MMVFLSMPITARAPDPRRHPPRDGSARVAARSATARARDRVSQSRRARTPSNSDETGSIAPPAAAPAAAFAAATTTDTPATKSATRVSSRFDQQARGLEQSHHFRLHVPERFPIDGRAGDED